MMEFTEKELWALVRLMNDHFDMADIYGLTKEEYNDMWGKFSEKLNELEEKNDA